MKSIDSKKCWAFAALLGFPCLCHGQAGSPKVFMENANKAFKEKNIKSLTPKGDYSMEALTELQSTSDLAMYLKNSTYIGRPGQSTLAEKKLMAIVQDKSVESVQVVAFNVDTMASAAMFDSPVSLCSGQAVYCAPLKPGPWKKLKSGIEQLTATIGPKLPGQVGGQVVLVRDGGVVYGALTAGRKNFLVRQLKSGVFAVTQSKTDTVDRSREDVLGTMALADIAPKAPVSTKAPLIVKVPEKSSHLANASNCPNPSEHAELELVVLATPRAKAEALKDGHDVRQLVRTAESIANTSFQNSKINGSVSVVSIGEVAYAETGDFERDIKELLAEGGSLQRLRRTRRESRADIGVLVVENSDPKKCGMAAGIGVAKEKAYVVVNWRCLTDKFSFIHEVGHLAGAWHDRASLPAGVEVQPSYAAGYVTTGSDPVATIMAYKESCMKPCGRVWYWSNPETKFEDGQVLGTREHNFDACIWRRRIHEMAKFNGGD